jgi:hypothetical protein
MLTPGDFRENMNDATWHIIHVGFHIGVHVNGTRMTRLCRIVAEDG